MSDSGFYPVLGSRHFSLNNIPRNIAVGYKNTDSGKVFNDDGTFLLHTSIDIKGQSGPLSIRNEFAAGWSVKFSELPCDEKGNILVISHFFSELTTVTPESMRLVILCSKEPTHRINLSTGETIDNSSDNQYIKDMVIYYTVNDCSHSN